MALREDEVIVLGALRIRPVVAEVAGNEHGEQVGGRQGRGRVARAGRRRAADRVDAELTREIGDHLQVICWHG